VPLVKYLPKPKDKKLKNLFSTSEKEEEKSTKIEVAKE
jgi:hypothetical protein